jgi:hypothetical protein
MRFRLEADFLFEADDLADAQRRLAAHFLRSSASGESEMEQRGPRGFILVVPAEDEREETH